MPVALPCDAAVRRRQAQQFGLALDDLPTGNDLEMSHVIVGVLDDGHSAGHGHLVDHHGAGGTDGGTQTIRWHAMQRVGAAMLTEADREHFEHTAFDRTPKVGVRLDP